MGSFCQTQVKIKVSEDKSQLEDPLILSNMNLNIAVRLRDLDAHGNNK